MWGDDPEFSEVGQEHNILRSQGECSIDGVRNLTHLRSGFCQFLDIFLTLQVLELVAELIIDAFVNEKLCDEIRPTYLTTSSPTSGMYLFNVAINLE